MSLPYVSLAGNAVADAEIRFTHAGKAIGSFRVACSNRVRDASGEWSDGESLFITVTVFGALAETVAESVLKGTKVSVTGRLKSRTWETREGQKRTDFEVVADEVALGLKPPRSNGTRQAAAGKDDPWSQSPTWGPGNEPQGADAPF